MGSPAPPRPAEPDALTFWTAAHSPRTDAASRVPARLSSVLRIAGLLSLCCCATANTAGVTDACREANSACVSRCFGERGLIKPRAATEPPCVDTRAYLGQPPCTIVSQPIDTLEVAICSNGCDDAIKRCR